MAEIHYNSSITGWSTTFSMSVAAPLLKDRIFEKKSEAKTYIDNPGGTAVAGLILSVISDTEANNGIYQVQIDPSSPNGLKLHKIGPDLKVESHIKNKVNTETSNTDYVSLKSGDKETKIYTISTDMLRNGSLTLVLDGNF